MATIPPACTTCARNMGPHCLAMETWEPRCWARTEDADRVRRELLRAVYYCREREHGRAAREVLAELRALERSWAAVEAYEQMTKGA